MTNEAQLPMMKNMLNSALKSGWDMSMFHCYILGSQKEAASYGTTEFKTITIRKLEVILHNMLLDSEVIWIDNDIVLFQNCVEHLRSKPGDFVMQDDIWSPCTGFFLARKTPLALSKIKNSIRWLISRLGQSVNDQHAFTAVSQSFPRATITLLDRAQYPNGEIYFNQKITAHAKMVHCNYLTKTDEKVVRLKEHGFWDESDEAFSKVNIYHI